MLEIQKLRNFFTIRRAALISLGIFVACGGSEFSGTGSGVKQATDKNADGKYDAGAQSQRDSADAGAIGDGQDVDGDVAGNDIDNGIVGQGNEVDQGIVGGVLDNDAGIFNNPNNIDIGAQGPGDNVDLGNYKISNKVDQDGDVISNVTDTCVWNYPYQSNNPKTNVDFNEQEILIPGDQFLGPNDTLRLYYSDEHALTLGVREVVVAKTDGTQEVTSYDFSSMTSQASPDFISGVNVGSLATSGLQAAVDLNECPPEPNCARPLYPALFLTDITSDPNSTSGDWQFGGEPIGPHVVLGTWKAAIKTIDEASGTYTTTPEADPNQNPSIIGTGVTVDTTPTGVFREEFNAEMRWHVAALGLKPGHTYRAQFMIHDGDGSDVGGDVGQGCATITMKQ
jgi:hypothetical protein